MGDWHTLGRSLILIGIGIAVIGVLLSIAGKFPGLNWFGKLPGDISIKREHVSFYFPIATSLLISLVLSLLVAIFSWLFRR
ncbi:MAG: DUF2905 domain-containing protein [Nitrospiraceae bacterium]|jgi:hypothetical protein